jgi:hypothetical protein
MQAHNSMRSSRAAIIAGLGLGLCLPIAAAEPAPVAEKAEKIEFSSHRDAVRLPDANDGRDPSKLFESLQRGNSMAGVVEPLGADSSPIALPQAPPDQRIKELMERKLDQRKNWIYSTSSDLQQNQTAEQVMQVRDYDLMEGDQRQDRLSAFFNSKGKGASATAKIQPSDSTSPVLPDAKADATLLLRSALSTSAAPDAKPAQPDGLPALSALPWASPERPSPGTAASLLNLNPTSPAVEAARAPVNIRALLGTPDGLNPLAISDPINLPVDTTRQAINPITPQRPMDVALDRQMDLASQLGLPARAGNDRSSALDEMASKLLGPSSLAPAVVVPTAPEVFRPQSPTRPGTVQLPARKF